ncbi:hypothetical protein [Staphylococcus simulans]|uniref:hypothetical protein n=1 Tax=Staphylococcus simulans TaxID=1286 RepID=UPI002DB69EAE|nr:hypothetical protein [Staphylococcus simulans]MEB6838054.1 hypothetical protein [Staphylococcus simulans]
MKNTKIYENLMKDLVNQVIEYYEIYKESLNKFNEKVDPIDSYFMSNTNRPISMYRSTNELGEHSHAAMDESDKLEWELGHLREKLGYIKQFSKTFDQVIANRECLLNSINQLNAYTNYTKEKLLDSKDAKALFYSIKNSKLNWYISGLIFIIEIIERNVDKYLKEKRERYLEGIVLKEEGAYKIQQEGIVEKEKELFNQLNSAIEYDLKQIKKEEDVFDEMVDKTKEIQPTKSVKMYNEDWLIAYQVKAKTGANLVDIVSEAMELLKEKYNI